MSTEVEYREIPNFPNYRVGDDGSVQSRRPNRNRKYGKGQWQPLAVRLHQNGYQIVSLYQDGKGIRCFVHRIVLEAFIGPCPPDMQACHNDGNRINNRLANLRWDSRKANERDKIRHGTRKGFGPGSINGMAKLSEADVLEIRALHASGLKQREIAERFGVQRSRISQIVNRIGWCHI